MIEILIQFQQQKNMLFVVLVVLGKTRPRLKTDLKTKTGTKVFKKAQNWSWRKINI